jgi:DNA mismatch repair ATPase MutL
LNHTLGGGDIGVSRAFLQQLLDTQGALETPQAVHRVMASTACRTAYMFGDVLSQHVAQRLLEELGRTERCDKLRESH